MIIVQNSYIKGNSIEFVGVTGFMGPSQTEFGIAIDVADNRADPCLWVHVVPVNVDPSSLQPRTPYRIRGIVVHVGQRPIIVGIVGQR